MVFNPIFFLPECKLSWKVQARMEDKVRIKNLKSLFAFFEKFGREYSEKVKKLEFGKTKVKIVLELMADPVYKLGRKSTNILVGG